MKQVTYEFNWVEIIEALVHEHEMDLHDGFWQVGLITESATASLSPSVPEQAQVTIPGHVVRVLGLRFIPTTNFGPMTFQIKEGCVKYGPDPDNGGSVESGEGPGEDCGYVGEVPPTA